MQNAKYLLWKQSKDAVSKEKEKPPLVEAFLLAIYSLNFSFSYFFLYFSFNPFTRSPVMS
jgi:hypothetical protein